jgi:hypothetical protein
VRNRRGDQGDGSPSPSHSPTTCGAGLDPPALAEWMDQGGPDGRLGCPTGSERDAGASPAGSHAGVAPFGEAGAIVTALSGPDQGKAFVVLGCAWRLYFQYGGPGGWLGLPVEDARNNPDGQSQTFEGGVIVATRAYDSCDAQPAGPHA